MKSMKYRKYRKDEPKEYSSPELLMKRGRWSLWKGDDESSLWHQCSKTKEEVYGHDNPQIVLYPVRYVRFDHMTRKDVKPAWRCGMCMKPPPESILSVYILHNFDSISNEMGRRYIIAPGLAINSPGKSTI